MADAPTLGSVLATVVPVMVGGLIAIAGGGGTQWYLHKLKSEEEKKAKRAAKFEEIVGALHEHKHWLTVKESERLFGVEGTKLPSPLGKASAIACLHFPEIKPSIKDLQGLSTKYELWMLERMGERLAGKEVSREGMIELFKAFGWKFDEVVSALEELARREK